MVQNELTDGLGDFGRGRDRGPGGPPKRRGLQRGLAPWQSPAFCGVLCLLYQKWSSLKGKLARRASARKGYRVSPFRGGRNEDKEQGADQKHERVKQIGG